MQPRIRAVRSGTLPCLEQRFNAVSRDKIQGDAVDAIPQSRWRGTVFKDVTEVASTSIADNFHSSHAMTQVHAFVDAIGSSRLVKSLASRCCFSNLVPESNSCEPHPMHTYTPSSS